MVITDLRFTFCRLAKQWKADATRPRERSCFFAPGNDPNGPAVSIDDFARLCWTRTIRSPTGPAPEIGIEGNARKLALEVLRVFFAVNRVMQHAIDAMKDAVLGDRPRTLRP
jgi:hypothetical protein